MAVLKKIAGLVAGASAVAVIGVAVAQGVPPNPFVTNPALGAGQQSSHLTSMGETGVPGLIDQVQTAQVITEQPVAVVEQPAVVAQAPAPVIVIEERQSMGAAPAPAEPAPMAPPKRRPRLSTDCASCWGFVLRAPQPASKAARIHWMLPPSSMLTTSKRQGGGTGSLIR